MRASFHHQPEAQHPIFQLPTSWADYSIFGSGADITPLNLAMSAFRSCSRSGPCSLPQGKRKKPHIEVSGRSHTESPVEWVNAVSDPEGHASDDKCDCCSWNKSHLTGGCVDAECRSPDKEQSELLQGIVDDAAIDLHRQVLLLQRWIDSLAEK